MISSKETGGLQLGEEPWPLPFTWCLETQKGIRKGGGRWEGGQGRILGLSEGGSDVR